MAFMANEVTVHSTPEFQSCDLLTSPKSYMSSTLGNMLPKKSPLSGIFNYVARTMIERGAFDKIARKYEQTPQSEYIYKRIQNWLKLC